MFPPEREPVKITRPLLLVVPVLALLGAACGSDSDDDSTSGDPDSMSDENESTTEQQATERTVGVEMVDNAFEPTSVDIEMGETIRFVFENTGAVAHDALIGDADAQAEHEEEMSEAEGMEHGAGDDGGDGDAITVEPGETGELVYTFDEPGALEIGCHEPGHYTAGMKIDVNV